MAKDPDLAVIRNLDGQPTEYKREYKQYEVLKVGIHSPLIYLLTHSFVQRPLSFSSELPSWTTPFWTEASSVSTCVLRNQS